MRNAALFFTLALSLLAAAPGALAADSNRIWPAEVSIPNTRQIEFTSAINGEPYALFVSIPFIPPPPGGYPVYYVLDGEAYFSTAAIGSMLLLENAAVVVGIDHNAFNDRAVVEKYSGRKPGDTSPIGMDAISDAYNRLRRHDFTSPIAPAHRAPAWFEPPESGGVDDFLKIIEREIKPKIAALVPVNTANQAIYGHSMGGLAVVHAFFTEPNAFRSFIASSPSLWWDGDAVLKDEAKFAAAVTAGRAAPRILITAGGDEADSTLPPKAFLDSLTPEKRAEIAPYFKMRSTWSGMITGTQGLAARLAALYGARGYKVEYARMAGEDHPTAALVSVGRGLRFAFGGARFKFEKSPPGQTQAQVKTTKTNTNTTVVFDAEYAGYYRQGTEVLHLFRESSRFYAQGSGQPPVELKQDSPTQFSAAPGTLTFERNRDGEVTDVVLVNRDGRSVLPRIDDTTARALDDRERLEMARTAPHPGTGEALKRQIIAFQNGTPHYDGLGEPILSKIRSDPEPVMAALRKLGALKSIRFRSPMASGADEFVLTFERGEMDWVVSALTVDGKITHFAFKPSGTR